MDTLNALIQRLKQNGATRILYKPLSANDNTKQQIYIGGNWEVLSVLPFGEIQSYPEVKQPNFKAPVNLYWMNEEGQVAHAPGAQLIMYPKYPEIRLSGFLKGCPLAPSAYMQPNPRTEGRILVLGICPDRRILAHLLLPEQAITAELLDQPVLSVAGVFRELILDRDPLEELLEKLHDIHQMGFVDSCRLNSSGQKIQYAAQNGGGYTLEALLDIIPNGHSEPDFRGIEIKQFGVKRFDRLGSPRITLMTPEPVGGIYVNPGVIPFLHLYGKPEPAKDRIYFTGTHQYGVVHATTGLRLDLQGYNITASGKFEITDITKGIMLVDPRTADTVAALWTFQQIIDHWSKKHGRTVYVPAISQQKLLGDEKTIRQYHYNDQVWLGVSTDPIRFFRSLLSKKVYYDPGTKVENLSGTPVTKRRNQFRMNFKNLASLYDTFELK